MIKIAITGAGGRMGKTLIKAISMDDNIVLTAAIEREGSSSIGLNVGESAGIERGEVFISSSLREVVNDFDVLIDFSSPSATEKNTEICRSSNKRMVIGTTGLTDQQIEIIIDAAETNAICMASNFATGVNLCFKLAEISAMVLGNDATVEISEVHHKNKVDAPSGTALSLGEYAAVGRKTSLNKSKVLDRTKKLTNRKKGDIGFSVTRGGEIAGEHTVSFIGENDRVDLVHKANNRSIFVKGAIDAAIFLSNKKSGFYTMNDLLFSK